MNVGVARNAATGVVVYYDMDDPADFKRALEIISGKRKQEEILTKAQMLQRSDIDHALNCDITILVVAVSQLSVMSPEKKKEFYLNQYLPAEKSVLTYKHGEKFLTSNDISIVRNRIASVIGDDYLKECERLYGNQTE